jgi:transposase
MFKVKEVIRLNEQAKLTKRAIARALNISRPSVDQYLMAFTKTGLKYDDIKDMTDDQVKDLFVEKEEFKSEKLKILYSRFEYMAKELKKTGVTLQLLWEEYKQEYPDGYESSQFGYYYQKWRESLNVSMHIEHKSGDKMFADFTGDHMSIHDPKTGEEQEMEIFVAILGGSQLTYAEAVESQKKHDWIKVNENALHYFDGSPNATVPDNLKSGVAKVDKYEPHINPEYNDYARHYSMVILPARSKHPKDKALVENAVRIIYRRIFAPLRNRIFYSLQELNEAIWEQLEKHNNMKFKKMKISRRELFEEIERKELKPLPSTKYEFKTIVNLTVQYNYHVYLKEDIHYYSVPYIYFKKNVTLIYTDSVVEIYYKNERIALHKRDRSTNKYTTLPEHMVPDHKFYAEWSPERMIKWGEKLGDKVKEMIEGMFESSQHPEQAFKICMGTLNLAKKYGRTRLNNACARALSFDSYSFNTIRNILKKGLDKLEEETTDEQPLPDHEHVRGAEYYEKIHNEKAGLSINES